MVKTQAYTCSHGKVLFASNRPDSQSAAGAEEAAKLWLSGVRMMKFISLYVARYLQERS
jgi:hypothetical protein